MASTLSGVTLVWVGEKRHVVWKGTRRLAPPVCEVCCCVLLFLLLCYLLPCCALLCGVPCFPTPCIACAGACAGIPLKVPEAQLSGTGSSSGSHSSSSTSTYDAVGHANVSVVVILPAVVGDSGRILGDTGDDGIFGRMAAPKQLKHQGLWGSMGDSCLLGCNP